MTRASSDFLLAACYHSMWASTLRAKISHRVIAARPFTADITPISVDSRSRILSTRQTVGYSFSTGLMTVVRRRVGECASGGALPYLFGFFKKVGRMLRGLGNCGTAQTWFCSCLTLFLSVSVAAHAQVAPSASESPSSFATDGTPVTDKGEPQTPPAAPAPAERTLADVDKTASIAALAGHNAWMLTSSALVLFMTAPGLAMFYGGLVRKKNVLSVLIQCVFLMGLMTVLWALYGYSLSFGGTNETWALNKWIGNGDYLFMNNVQSVWVPASGDTPGFSETPYYDAAGADLRIPRLTHMLFQGMFFIITPALICGAFAERMKFSTMVVFSILWGTIVYCPLCHCVWGGGALAFTKTSELSTGNGIMGGALDFAGGTVVHISSGVTALICALYMGKRLGYGKEAMPPHNLTYTVLGAAMLWVGWFGFNAGSELASDELTSSAFCVTHFAAAAGTLAWAGMEWLSRGKPSALGAASGAIAGLVCITPAAGFVQPMPALAMGALAGMLCFYTCTTMKSKFGYDDSLDAFGVHGVGGTLGAVLTGVFATRACWNIDEGQPLGLIEGAHRIFLGQLVVAAITIIFAAVVSFVLLKILDVTMGLRVSSDEERQGLDLSQHGEEGYIFI